MRKTRPMSLARRCIFLLVPALAGCHEVKHPDPPREFELALYGGYPLNPDEQGQSLTTLVRVFQLTSPAKVEAADLQSLYRHEKETLGEELLQVDDVMLKPKSTERKTIALNKDAKCLAVVGVFRRPAGLTWRSIIPMPPTRSGALQFHLDDYHVTRPLAPTE